MGNFVDETLEGLTGVSETETHEGEFEEAERGNDSCFGDVSFVDRDLGVGLVKIDYRKDSASMKAMGAIVDVFWWVFIRDGACVEIPVVAARAPSGCFLWDEVER